MVRFAKKRKVEEVPETVLPAEYGDSVILKFYDADGKGVGDEIAVNMSATKDELIALLKSNLNQTELDLNLEYSLVLCDNGLEVTESLTHTFLDAIKENIQVSTESQLKIGFYALSNFRVRPVTRLTGSLDGHRGNILCCQFSPDSSTLATGSGDCEVRLWDLDTSTPKATLSGHTRIVQCLAWSPDGKWLATGSEDKSVRVWRMDTISMKGTAHCTVLMGHKHSVVAVAFQPAHLYEHWSSGAPKLVSAARDGSIKVWDIVQGNALLHLDGHSQMVTAVKWSGMMEAKIDGKKVQGPFIYSSGRDMAIKLWSAVDGRQLQNVKSHGHWVNSFSLNTEALVRFGPFDALSGRTFSSQEEMISRAKSNWEKNFRNLGEERMVTCSDDNTLALWRLLKSAKPLAKMLGHQRPIYHVCFSPNGRFIASAGSDSCIKLWDGRNGAFITTYRGHVSAVHQVSWSADSQMFVSGSSDSTLKVWKITDKIKAQEDLPGHADEVFALDWAPDGSKVGSGGRDKKVYIWAH